MSATSSVEQLATPDFDSYVCRETIVAADVVSATTVVVRWSDGREDRHHPWTLRENATDPTTTSAVTADQAGEHHLSGCYVDRDDLCSRLRMLARAGHRRALGG